MAHELTQDWISNHDDILSTDSQFDTEEDENDYDPKDFSGVRDNDRELLQQEEEREKLLTSGIQREDRTGPHDGRRSRRKVLRPRKSRPAEKADPMYEMEEGGFKDDRSSQASSSSLELDTIQVKPRSVSNRRTRILYISSSLSIAILFCLLAFGAFKASHKSLENTPLSLVFNGSHQFAPTTILISLDGFRADFLHRNITPTLNSFIAEGISPKYMLPSFPSVTFPNHYTLATGLYPESHGVVGNTFWDPELEAEFYYTDPARSMHPKWWRGGEPLWVTAERQNVRTAIHMWPGSEAHLLPEPTYVDAYNGEESLNNKVDRIFQFLDIPDTGPNLQVIQRPQLIAAYVPIVDADGHKYGPNSTEIQKTIASVDSMLLDILTGLANRNLTKIVNIVLVSDHGMATTSIDRLIQLDDLIDLNLVSHMDGWPLYGLRPKNASDLLPLYETLLAAQTPNFEVYLRDVNMPERYHFSHNPRIAPLWLVPKTGWAIVHKADFDVSLAKERGETYNPKGLHGYDHEHPLMRAIFVARGPAFPHVPNSRVANFQNIEVYNIVCDSLGIEPRPNNGTLRLPLVPVGLHSDDVDDEASAIPEDFTGDQYTTSSSALPSSSSTDSSTSSPSSATATATAAIPPLSSKNNTLLSTPGEKADETKKTIWDNLIAKLEEAKAWLAGLVSSSSEKKEG